MNTHVSKLVAIAQTMTNAERKQWLEDIEYEYGKNGQEYDTVQKAVTQANAAICWVPK